MSYVIGNQQTLYEPGDAHAEVMRAHDILPMAPEFPLLKQLGISEPTGHGVD